MLQAAGLTAAEESTYLTLVRQGSAPLPQLADRTELTAAQVRRALAGLHRKGLVHRTPAPHDKVVPVPPDLAVEQLIQRRMEELERTREAAHRLADEAQHRVADRSTEDLIEIVSGRAAVGRAFDRVQRTARREMRVLVAPPFAKPNEVNRTQLDREAAGVVYRGVYDASVLDDQASAAAAAVHVRSGEQARLIHSLPTKLAIADSELALLPLSYSTTAHDAALLVHPCGLLDALVALFETVWALATPLSLGARDELAGDQGISAGDRQLLSLLVAGLTDEAAAARLGVSRRTVVRRVQHLMEMTNSRSRLQLGWQARERGWL
ncbi:TrmB family transcriptional regulator [Micromonospora sp. CPCC 206061]|uniref:TrmB family transcriptional regulator n=1 Tax=Micromonospora sp. CPCC 206061 TaxID=3122410 RepID=UPI002FF227A1